MAEIAFPGSGSESRRTTILLGYNRRLWALLSLPLVLFLGLPLVALFAQSSPLRWMENLQKPQVIQAILLSMGTTLVATGLTVVFGTPVAYLLARRRFLLHRAVDTLVDLPTVLPPAVAGVALLLAFGRRGLVGEVFDQWGVHIAFTPIAVVLAQTFIAAPFYIKAATLGFSSVEPELEQAAALDGASSWEIFRYVILPLSTTALVSGSAMTWARALGEFGATIIFAGNLPGRTQTMPLAIYLGFELDLDVAITLSVILVACSFLALMFVKGVIQRQEIET